MGFVKAVDGLLAKVGMLLFGRFMVQYYPFEELFLLEEARKVRGAVKMPLVLIGGVCSLANMAKAMDEGFDFVQVGRASIRDPNIVRKMEQGEVQSSDCDHCNRCVAVMNGGPVYCVCNKKGHLKRRFQPKGKPSSWRA